MAAAEADVGRLLGVSGAHLARARAANSALAEAAALPAYERYTGVVHGHLDVGSLAPAARRRALGSAVVVSGLLGVVGLDDPVPDYRLKMGASLDPLGKLSTWWRDRLSRVLNEWLTDRVVIDALPKEHLAAWTPEPDRYAGWVQLRFESVRRDGSRVAVGHDAKAAKGLVVRHIAASRSRPVASLRAFDAQGWRLDPAASELGAARPGRAAFVREASR